MQVHIQSHIPSTHTGMRCGKAGNTRHSTESPNAAALRLDRGALDMKELVDIASHPMRHIGCRRN